VGAAHRIREEADPVAARYLFYSHDGYGLGHVRRNSVIARAVLATDAGAQVSLVTGIEVRPRWLRPTARVRVHRVPPMLKSADETRKNAVPTLFSEVESGVSELTVTLLI